mmetsp:Transcript_18100/g.20866  ORF Transcript_18100/g.20866 Transcript_18100/m.20866 type:complete len:667 (-) Transcript_18100:13-2013(-)
MVELSSTTTSGIETTTNTDDNDDNDNENNDNDNDDNDNVIDNTTTTTNDNNTKNNDDTIATNDNKNRRNKREHYSSSKIFQDSIVVNIPMEGVTADLGIAIRRSREKRIKAIHKKFPSLKQQQQGGENNNTSNVVLDSEDEADNTSKMELSLSSNTKNNKVSNKYVPQRGQYGNVLDYLEAKYVKGVMIQDDAVAEMIDNGGDTTNTNNTAANSDDEKGSVYDSESSFLDDSLLKRDVTEQVLSQATHTKLNNTNNNKEVSEEGNNANNNNNDDDDSFFVNVGTLEVEDHELMDYDPLAEEDEEEGTKKKRGPKPSSSSSSKNNTTKGGTKRKRLSMDSKGSVNTKGDKSTMSKKSSTKSSSKKKDDNKRTKKSSSSLKKSSSSASLGKEATASVSKKKQKQELTPEMKEQVAALKKRAFDLKKRSDELFAATRDAIKKMTDKELPRKKKNEKVSIVVPEGKKPGDDITFSNPHVKGQKLRVKIPAKSKPGSKFVVSVPVPVKSINTDVDNNKWPREAQDLLDEFSHAYDDWCHAEAAWREMDPIISKKFQLHHERMNKFNTLLTMFPKDLITPVDGTYLRKVVRRARQNKHKRTKTAQKLSADEQALQTDTAGTTNSSANPPSSDLPTTGRKTDSANGPSEKKYREIRVPGKGREFVQVMAPRTI